MSEAMDRRDELLRRLLLEEADPLAAFEASELAGDAEARAELEGLLEAERRLAALGTDERELLRAPARDSAEHAAEERVLARVRERVAAPAPALAPAPRPRGLGARWALLLAAGLALALGLRWFGGSGEVEPDPGTSLGGGTKPVIEQPHGEVEAFAPIVWSGRRATGQRFRVRVLDGRAAGVGSEVARSGLLEDNRWEPTEAEWTSWPNEIRLRVDLMGSGPDETVVSSDEVRAQR